MPLRTEFLDDLAVQLPGELDQGWLMVDITLNTSSLRPQPLVSYHWRHDVDTRPDSIL